MNKCDDNHCVELSKKMVFDDVLKMKYYKSIASLWVKAGEIKNCFQCNKLLDSKRIDYINLKKRIKSFCSRECLLAYSQK